MTVRHKDAPSEPVALRLANRGEKPLWTCPRCSHRFVTRNMFHSCGRYEISDHFTGKDPRLRELFELYLALVQRFGPVHVYAQKTRIVFQVRVRFAGAIVRHRWLEGAMWLKHRVESPRFHRIETITSRDHVHYFRLQKPEDLDQELAELLRESYAVGCQNRLR